MGGKGSGGKPTHGKSNSRVYEIWCGMTKRCFNKNSKAYRYYGGRGITVDEHWCWFENFYEDMGDPPSKRHSLDRIDNDGPYAHWNCRWATDLQQANNSRHCNYLEIDGEKKSLSEWARIYKISRLTVMNRLRKGWDTKKALSEKPLSWSECTKEYIENRKRLGIYRVREQSRKTQSSIK